MRKLLDWVKNNKKESYPLIALLLVATFLRLYRIDEYLPFLGDEGRDVRVVSRFLTDFDLMFIGPRTSIGDMYLGPLYYYLIAPFLWIWNFSPTGPAVFVGILGTATVALVWITAREWFGKVAAFSSAVLYSVSPLIIDFSRHSWNPNIMPFFALLCVYSIWRIWQRQEYKWLIILGTSFAFVAQSHYLGLLLIPTLGIVWLLSLFKVRNTKRLKNFLVFSFLGISIFALLMSPLLLFDVKHNWQNTLSLKKFFFERQSTVSAKPWNAIPLLWPFWSDSIIKRFLLAQKEITAVAVTLASLFFWAGYIWKKQKESQKLSAHFILGLWVLLGLLGMGLLKQNIYDHYFGFLFPAPFLITGAVSQGLWERKPNLRWLLLIAISTLVVHNLMNNPLKNPPQRQMDRVQEIDSKIIQESKGKPFNFGLIAKRNYEEGYLYFFEQWNAQVKEIDPQNMQNTLTEQLFVVCEDPICEPINNPKAEIANFGWAKIEQEWEVRGFKLFKLTHRQ